MVSVAERMHTLKCAQKSTEFPGKNERVIAENFFHPVIEFKILHWRRWGSNSEPCQ